MQLQKDNDGNTPHTNNEKIYFYTSTVMYVYSTKLSLCTVHGDIQDHLLNLRYNNRVPSNDVSLEPIATP